MTVERTRAPRAAWVVFAVALVCAVLLALPGRTVTTVYVNDLLIFLDGAHRIVSGQIPNRDFHTALGPLSFYIPAAGYWLSGDLGGAMPVGMALLLLLLAPAIAYVTSSRLHPAIAVPFGIFVLLILAAPVNLGEGIGSLSFAMFYNRIGWAALATLLVMYLGPRGDRPRRPELDALCAALFTIVMLTTKVTYGLVALAFLAFMLFDRFERRWSALALALTLGGCLVIEVFWQSLSGHVSDLLLAKAVSGSRTIEDLTLGLVRHLADYVLMGMLVALAVWKTRRIRDVLFFGFVAGPGLLIMAQNSQPWGIITLHAGASVAAELLIRPEPQRSLAADGHEARLGLPLASGAPLVLLALLLPTIVHCSVALVLHAGLATAGSGESFGMPRFEGVRLARLWSPGDHDFSARYLASLQDGARSLSELEPRPSAVSVLDFVSPFSAGLGLTPPCGDSSWLHWERNVDAVHFLPPEELLGGVRVLMVPKWGINSAPLLELYGGYIGRAFEQVRDGPFWTVLLRRGAEPRPGPAGAARCG